MKQIYAVLFYLVIVFCWSANAQQEPITVEATRIDPRDLNSSSYILDQKTIEKKNVTDISETLTEVPGLTVLKNGGAGQTTTVFIRGSRSEDTLVLIDGFEVNDILSPGKGFDFSNLSALDVEEIEILKGPQSVRYGSGAMGGVINIKTKKGTGTLKQNYRVGGGSFGTGFGAAHLSRKIGTWGFAGGADLFRTTGFSAASESSGNQEPDGYTRQNYNFKTNYAFSELNSLEGIFRYSKTKTDLDTTGGFQGDDPNNRSRGKNLMTGFKSNNQISGNLESSTGIFFGETERFNMNDSNPSHPFESRDHFLSESGKIENRSRYTIDSKKSLYLDLQYKGETGFSNSSKNNVVTNIPRKDQNTFGGALTYTFTDEIFFEGGARLDEHSTYGETSSYRFLIGKLFNDTKLQSVLATGFKTPSLYQLYSSYGTPTLSAETVESFEVSIEHQLSPSEGTGNFVGLTYFNNKFKNLIDFNQALQKYSNTAKVKTEGFELMSGYAVTTHYQVKVSYMNLSSKDEISGLTMLRKPQQSWTVGFEHTRKNWSTELDYRYLGSREDIDPISFNRINAGSAETIGWNLNYFLSPETKIFLKADNVFDRVYEEVAGYTSTRRSVLVGLQGEF